MPDDYTTPQRRNTVLVFQRGGAAEARIPYPSVQVAERALDILRSPHQDVAWARIETAGGDVLTTWTREDA